MVEISGSVRGKKEKVIAIKITISLIFSVTSARRMVIISLSECLIFNVITVRKKSF